MAKLTIKDIPDELYQRLKQRALEHQRDVESEAIVCLERALIHVQPDEEELIEQIRQLRAEFPGYLTEEQRRGSVREGVS